MRADSNPLLGWSPEATISSRSGATDWTFQSSLVAMTTPSEDLTSVIWGLPSGFAMPKAVRDGPETLTTTVFGTLPPTMNSGDHHAHARTDVRARRQVGEARRIRVEERACRLQRIHGEHAVARAGARALPAAEDRSRRRGRRQRHRGSRCEIRRARGAAIDAGRLGRHATRARTGLPGDDAWDAGIGRDVDIGLRGGREMRRIAGLAREHFAGRSIGDPPQASRRASTPPRTTC